MSQNPDSYFAAVAQTYDRLQPVMVGPSYERGLDMMVDLIPFDHADTFTFVELGCGTAEPTARALRRFVNARAICFDSEPAMLAIARQKLLAFASRTQIVEADVARSDIPACNAILAAKVFHHLAPDGLEQLLEQAATALLPNGCVIVFDHMFAAPAWGERIVKQLRRIKQHYLAREIEVGHVTQDEVNARWALKRQVKAQDGDAEYYHDAEELCSTMCCVGFEEAGIVWRWGADTIVVGYR